MSIRLSGDAGFVAGGESVFGEVQLPFSMASIAEEWSSANRGLPKDTKLGNESFTWVVGPCICDTSQRNCNRACECAGRDAVCEHPIRVDLQGVPSTICLMIHTLIGPGGGVSTPESIGV